MTRRLATVLVGFGAVAADAGRDPKVAKHFRYATHAAVLRDHPRFDWRAVVDPSDEARRRAREEWQVPIAVASVALLPHDFQPDVAVLATPPDARLSVLSALPGLAAALVEKPVATTCAEGAALARHCAERGMKVNVNLFRRGDKTSRTLRSGRFRELVGDVQTVTVLYGNGLRNNGVHAIDQLRMLAGDVVSVRALSPMRPARSKVRDDGEAAAALELQGGGVCFLHPLDFQCFRDVYLDFWGTAGRLEIFQEGLFLRHSPVREHRALSDALEMAIDEAQVEATECGSAFYEMYSNLADTADGTAEPFCSLDEALRSEAVVEGVFLSARESGRLVPMQEVLGGR